MTIGTAIVVSVGIITVAWLATIGIGVWLTNKKQSQAKEIANTISKRIFKD
jgi:hypothetical protein